MFDFDDCEFNDLTKDLPEDTPVKITVDEPNIDPLEIKVSDWRGIMKARLLLRMSIHYLEDYSTLLWGENICTVKQKKELIECISSLIMDYTLTKYRVKAETREIEPVRDESGQLWRNVEATGKVTVTLEIFNKDLVKKGKE